MKKLLLQLCMLAGVSTAFGQNALLQGSTTGTINSSSFADLCMVSDGTDAVLLVADMSSVYAIDIADNNAADAAANTVTTIPNFVADKLAPLVGASVTVQDIVVNPISKSVYVLGTAGLNNVIFKVEKNGANVSILNLNNVTYSKIDWTGTAFNINDMAYADGKLYVSSGTFSLDGELGWISSPFVHNSTFTKRSTTLFKSNWGGTYVTTAPLETLTSGQVDGKYRLMGVTTCAPGFSIDVNTLSGSGLLSVTEDFNIHQGQSKKAVFMHHDSKDWLFDLHDSKLYRIGKKYIDGSQVTANKYDNNAVKLRDNSGKVVTSLPDDEIKLMSTSTISMIAFWDNWSLLLLESGSTGALTRSKMSVENPAGVSSMNIAKQMEVYPNPAHNNITINLPQNSAQGMAKVISMNGAVAASSKVNGHTTTIDISNVAPGIYTLTVQLENGTSVSEKLTIE